MSLKKNALILGVLGGQALALTGCDQPDSKQAENALDRPVLVGPVHYAPRNSPRNFAAVIRPRIESDLSFRVAGKVISRFVDTGQSVKRGDPLGRLDDTDLKLQLDQAAAEAKAARAFLEQAEADERRSRALRREGWQAQAMYDRAATALEEARGRLTRAERAEELARNALSYSVLTAEADGVVTAAPIEPGQTVVPGQLAVRLARLDEKEAAAAIPETMAGEIGRGEVVLTLWSDPSKRYAARLRELAPVSDPVTRTYAARFSIPAADSKLILGMSATLTVTLPAGGDVAQLPLTALVNRGRGPCLWMVEGSGRLRLLPVEVQSYDATSVYITGGAPEGASAVLLGVQKLDESQAVRTVSRLTY
jgi:RND family efflux transporter MFP subunit